jgi:hypothetical protein
MAKFIQKSREVDAVQFLIGSNPDEWPEGIAWGGDRPEGTGGYLLRHRGEDLHISDGNWIVTSPGGTKRVYSDQVFALKFEPIATGG